MKIVDKQKIDLKVPCEVHYIHVVVTDVKGRAEEIIQSIQDTSWISKLNPLNQLAFRSRAEKTIKTLVENIFNKVNDTVTSDFGEYLVSFTAQESLCMEYTHEKFPIADLFKNRLLGNGGFDFHTESPNKFILFGEAKYKARSSPWKDALEQVNEFIAEGKDAGELVELQQLSTSGACDEFLQGRKGFAAAFSLNAVNKKKAIEDAIKSAFLTSLLTHTEIYLIGVEVRAE